MNFSFKLCCFSYVCSVYLTCFIKRVFFYFVLIYFAIFFLFFSSICCVPSTGRQLNEIKEQTSGCVIDLIASDRLLLFSLIAFCGLYAQGERTGAQQGQE